MTKNQSVICGINQAGAVETLIWLEVAGSVAELRRLAARTSRDLRRRGMQVAVVMRRERPDQAVANPGA